MQVTDPVCRMTIDSEQAAGREVWQGQTIISAPSPVAEIPCSSWALRQQDRQTCGRCASQLSGRARRSKRALAGQRCPTRHCGHRRTGVRLIWIKPRSRLSNIET